jgi:hypothetical protein
MHLRHLYQMDLSAGNGTVAHAHRRPTNLLRPAVRDNAKSVKRDRLGVASVLVVPTCARKPRLPV